MTHLYVRHKVQDFNTWKPVYDAHEPTRKAAGLTEEYLLRNKADTNDVVILFKVSSEAKERAFAKSEDLHEAMKRAGVVGVPEILELE